MVAAAAWCCAAATVTAAPAPTRPPNIVLIVADDLGFNELGYMNATRGLHTPNIDKLAAGGSVLRQYYAVPLCSPSRASLLTGVYNHRLGLQAHVIHWDTPWGVPLEYQFLPARLKPLGYRTGAFGKWHLGMHTTEYYPTSRGFDEYSGFLQGCVSHHTHVSSCCLAPTNPLEDDTHVCAPPEKGKDYRGYDFFQGTRPLPAVNLTTTTDIVASKAQDFIDRAARCVRVGAAGCCGVAWRRMLRLGRVRLCWMSHRRYAPQLRRASVLA